MENTSLVRSDGVPFVTRVWKAGAGGWATRDLSQPKHQTNNRSLQRKWNHTKFKSCVAQVKPGNLQQFSCLCFSGAGMSGVSHHAWLKFFILFCLGGTGVRTQGFPCGGHRLLPLSYPLRKGCVCIVVCSSCK